MTLEKEITLLTQKWYRYVNLDHHKDRDCHWYIEKVWSYGDEPYYVAYHNGYIGPEWKSPNCATEEMAQTLLRDKLKNLLASEIKHLQEMDKESLEWMGISKDKLEEVIKELV